MKFFPYFTFFMYIPYKWYNEITYKFFMQHFFRIDLKHKINFMRPDENEII